MHHEKWKRTRDSRSSSAGMEQGAKGDLKDLVSQMKNATTTEIRNLGIMLKFMSKSFEVAIHFFVFIKGHQGRSILTMGTKTA